MDDKNDEHDDEILDLVVRKRDLPKFTGIQRTAIDRAIAEGTFPKPIRLGSRSVGWLSSELRQWQLARIRERDAKADK